MTKTMTISLGAVACAMYFDAPLIVNFFNRANAPKEGK